MISICIITAIFVVCAVQARNAYAYPQGESTETPNDLTGPPVIIDHIPHDLRKATFKSMNKKIRKKDSLDRSIEKLDEKKRQQLLLLYSLLSRPEMRTAEK